MFLCEMKLIFLLLLLNETEFRFPNCLGLITNSFVILEIIFTLHILIKNKIFFFLNKYMFPESFNSSLHEFCFPSTFEIYPKTGSYRLRTHRRGKLFPMISFYFKIKFFLPNVALGPHYAAKG